MSTPLAKSAIGRLQAAYDVYMSAPLGTLNKSATQFQAVCRELGWISHASTIRALPWAREQLGLDSRGRPRA